MWHVKDMHKVSRDYTELGNGSIDYTQIWPDTEFSGMKHFFVEQGGNFSQDSDGEHRGLRGICETESAAVAHAALLAAIHNREQPSRCGVVARRVATYGLIGRAP